MRSLGSGRNAASLPADGLDQTLSGRDLVLCQEEGPSVPGDALFVASLEALIEEPGLGMLHRGGGGTGTG